MFTVRNSFRRSSRLIEHICLKNGYVVSLDYYNLFYFDSGMRANSNANRLLKHFFKVQVCSLTVTRFDKSQCEFQFIYANAFFFAISAWYCEILN